MCQRSNDSVILSRVTEPTSGRAETFGGRVASLLDASRGLRLTKPPRPFDVAQGEADRPQEHLPQRRDASRGHTAPAVCTGVHLAEIDRKFDEIVAFAETPS